MTVVSVSNKNYDDLCIVPNYVLSHSSKWFGASKLVISLDKTSIIKFITNNSPQYALCIVYFEGYVVERVSTKFLGLQIDDHLNLKNQMVPMLSGICYVGMSVSHISNIETLRSFHLFSLCNKMWNNFLWVTCQTVKIYFYNRIC
jgi:hypothetical protein